MTIFEAQVYGELTGLAQAAIDGRDVSLIACGPPGAGMSFTLCLDRQHSKTAFSPKDGRNMF